MKIIKKKTKKLSGSAKKLTFWNKVDEAAHYLIADKLNQVLPLPNCRDKKVFNPDDDADFRSVCADYEDIYRDKLPDLDQVSQEIAYEYLFLVTKSLKNKLRNFACHQEEYFTKL